MSKKTFLKVLSFVAFAIGVFFLINSQLSFTGAFLGARSITNIVSFALGILFLFIDILLFSTATMPLEKTVTLTSSIKKYPAILRLTQDAVKNQEVQRELDHLGRELQKGNFEAGLGHPGHIEGTDIYYLRGRNGGRLYYHKIGKFYYEIVAKSGKGTNQEQVIDKLRDIYH